MVLAASGSVDLGRLLLDLLIVLVAAKLAAELAERLRVAAVLGEIAAGVLLGPSVFGLVETAGDRGVSISLLAEIGVLLLLLSVGMEMDLGELVKVGRASMLAKARQQPHDILDPQGGAAAAARPRSSSAGR